MKKSLVFSVISTFIFLLPVIVLADGISIILKPMKVIEGNGVFLLDNHTSIIVPEELRQLSEVASQCAEGINIYTGIKVAVKETPITKELKNVIILKLLASSNDFNKEGYRLSVAKDRIMIESI